MRIIIIFTMLAFVAGVMNAQDISLQQRKFISNEAKTSERFSDEYLNTNVIDVGSEDYLLSESFEAYWTGKREQSLITPILQNLMEHIPTYNSHSGSQYVEIDGVFLSLNLSAYINQKIKVRFRAISDFGGAWAAVDDVKGVPLFAGEDENAITDFPWIESFGSQSSLEQWTVVDADGDGFSWLITDDGSGTNKAAGSFSWYNYTLYPDDYLISPPISLEKDTHYTLSYDAGSVISEFMPFYMETYSVMISTNGLNLESFEPIYTETLPDAEFRTLEFSLDEYAGQDIYIAFRHHDSSDEYILLIDNVRIDKSSDVAVDKVENNNVGLFPNPAKDYVKLSGLQENTSVYIYDLNGRKIREYQADNDLEINIDFPAGTYIVKVISDSGSVVKKMIVK